MRSRLKPQRITLADGKTIDLKLPQGLEDGTKIRLAGKGEEGPGGRGDAIVTIEIAPHRFYHARRQQHPPRPAGDAQGSSARREGESPDARRAGDADHSQGNHVGQSAASQGPRLHHQGRQAWRPAGQRRNRRARPAIRSCRSSQKAGTAAATRARALGFSTALHEGHLPPIAGSTAQTSGEHARGLRNGGRGEAQAEADGVGSGQARRRRSLQRRLHPRRQSRLSVDRRAVSVLHCRRSGRASARPEPGCAC